MRLIDMDSLWQCETCFHHKANGCDTWCDAGEAYRPSASKLKVIDPESLRKKGEWKNGVCTNCQFDLRCLTDGESDLEQWVWDEGFDFCPNCGADMRKGGTQ